MTAIESRIDKDTLQNLLQQSLTWGATHADIVISESVSTEYDHRAGAPEKIESARDGAATIRVFVGKSSAETSTNNLSLASLEAALKRAIEIAKLVPENPYAGPAPQSLLATDIPDYEQTEPTLIDTDRLKDMAARAEQAALAVEGITNSDGASASTGATITTLAMSNGFYAQKSSSSVGFHMVAVAEKEEEKVRESEDSYKIRLADLENPEDIGRKAGEKTVARLGSEILQGGTFPVLFSNEVSSSLIGAFYAAVSGDMVAQKRSFLIDDMGQKIFADNIKIIDDPTQKGRSASRPFDREGMKPEKIVLIENGKLQTWVVNLEQARKMGIDIDAGATDENTTVRGSAARTNLYMEAGTQSFEDMVKNIPDGLYVTGLMSVSQSLINGDYSAGIEGFWIKDGKITAPVAEMTIAGNLRDMFATAIPANDLDFKRSTSAPSLLIPKMRVGGL